MAMILTMNPKPVLFGAAASCALAAVSLVVWAAAIAAGRLLAYTCTRLTVDTLCE